MSSWSTDAMGWASEADVATATAKAEQVTREQRTANGFVHVTLTGDRVQVRIRANAWIDSYGWAYDAKLVRRTALANEFVGGTRLASCIRPGQNEHAGWRA